MKLFAIDYISDWGIYCIVCDVFNKYTTVWMRNDALVHAFSYGFNIEEKVSYQDLTRWMLGQISCIKIFQNVETLIDMEEEKINITL
jgi:hypothetical protein